MINFNKVLNQYFFYSIAVLLLLGPLYNHYGASATPTAGRKPQAVNSKNKVYPSDEIHQLSIYLVPNVRNKALPGQLFIKNIKLENDNSLTVAIEIIHAPGFNLDSLSEYRINRFAANEWQMIAQTEKHSLKISAKNTKGVSMQMHTQWQENQLILKVDRIDGVKNTTYSTGLEKRPFYHRENPQLLTLRDLHVGHLFSYSDGEFFHAKTFAPMTKKQRESILHKFFKQSKGKKTSIITNSCHLLQKIFSRYLK